MDRKQQESFNEFRVFNEMRGCISDRRREEYKINKSTINLFLKSLVVFLAASGAITVLSMSVILNLSAMSFDVSYFHEDKSGVFPFLRLLIPSCFIALCIGVGFFYSSFKRKEKVKVKVNEDLKLLNDHDDIKIQDSEI